MGLFGKKEILSQKSLAVLSSLSQRPWPAYLECQSWLHLATCPLVFVCACRLSLPFQLGLLGYTLSAFLTFLFSGIIFVLYLAPYKGNYYIVGTLLTPHTCRCNLEKIRLYADFYETADEKN